MIEIRSKIKKLEDSVRNNRRYLHAHPELGLDTPKTRAFIVEELKRYGFDVIEEGMASNGVVAQLKVNDEAQSIGFRSDMDALPTLEENKVEYRSINNNSHACGHDGHMAALLGLAKYLSENKGQLKENITFVFQPGEEGPGGAEIMIREGLFEKYPMKCILGMHLMGDVDAGYVACKAGPMMARNGEVEVKVHGKSAHGAMPQLGKDAIVAASYFVTQIQSVISRMLDPMQPMLFTIGKMSGGLARNVVSDLVEMSGTIRSFDDESYKILKDKIHTVARGIEESFDVRVEVDIEDYYLVVNNDVSLHEMFKEISKKAYIETTPKMIAEDFSFYQKEVPGLFYYTGVRDEEYQQDIHNSKFNFNEHNLLNSIEINVRMLEKLGAYHD